MRTFTDALLLLLSSLWLGLGLGSGLVVVQASVPPLVLVFCDYVHDLYQRLLSVSVSVLALVLVSVPALPLGLRVTSL